MFVDEKAPGEQQTNADPCALSSFMAWLKTQPADTAYDYRKSDTCVVAQWLKGTNVIRYNLGAEEVNRLFGGQGAFVIWGEGSANRDCTFGAALVRARSVS